MYIKRLIHHKIVFPLIVPCLQEVSPFFESVKLHLSLLPVFLATPPGPPILVLHNRDAIIFCLLLVVQPSYLLYKEI